MFLNRAEKMVKCPFNPLHIMTETALQRHIVRCMVNYPSFVTCPYNALHRFKNKELLHDHMSECESKERNYLLYDNVCKQDNAAFHIDNTREFNLRDENWDEN
ncbi:hypothetical protein NQ315_001905 [Exocentrus adspersus]|uniref:CHHC U11-48K-type domain-containing protein n=1 Tax=Exocentrus adspersus TaxID=1586481 RepID=A0AAV8WAY5_9CUCU|nr:hypothetical protein NQ315_001905 [Exocentrus adspersus]